MLVNSKTVVGNVYFTTYHFTGDDPKTDWEGKREIVIEQDLYVGLRELQLYFERSRKFREKTITHEKIERIKKSLHNRELGSTVHNNA